jgi:hypothetical protein
MASPEDLEKTAFLAPRVRTLQIIVGALVAGLLIIIAIMAFIPFAPLANNRAPQAAPLTPIITYIELGFVCILISVSVIVPSRVVASARKQLAAKAPSGDVAGLAAIYQIKTIVSGALREGIGNFAAVAFMLERQPIALGLAFACVIAVAALFPTRERVERWIDDQLVRLGQEREFGI